MLLAHAWMIHDKNGDSGCHAEINSFRKERTKKLRLSSKSAGQSMSLPVSLR